MLSSLGREGGKGEPFSSFYDWLVLDTTASPNEKENLNEQRVLKR